MTRGRRGWYPGGSALSHFEYRPIQHTVIGASQRPGAGRPSKAGHSEVKRWLKVLSNSGRYSFIYGSLPSEYVTTRRLVQLRLLSRQRVEPAAGSAKILRVMQQKVILRLLG